MSVKLVIDMNLSPDWVAVFTGEGWSATHWSTIGPPDATDRDVMEWALANRHVVFTHDLDFGTLLAYTKDTGPSVVQVRAQNVLPDHLAHIVVAAVRQHEALLESGALIVVDEARARIRILPLSR
jgi:predicted nuclease of predicted toxin-antitoxin system